MSISLDPPMLLAAYSQGAFPMTDADGVTRWYTADPRGVLPLDQFHCPKTLRALVSQRKYNIKFNHDFRGSMHGCMQAKRDKSETSWISDELINAYTKLHELGFAHSVEAYLNNELAGGLYGVSIGGVFFGESMFHTQRDASKVCLVHLVKRLRDRGYLLLDTQMVTNHMRQFGATEIPAEQYMEQLKIALEKDCTFV